MQNRRSPYIDALSDALYFSYGKTSGPKASRDYRPRSSTFLGLQRECLSGIEYSRAVLSLLNDAPRSGAPGKFSAEQICQIINVSCESPEDSNLPLSHWSLKDLTGELKRRGIVESISTSQLSVFLKSSRN